MNTLTIAHSDYGVNPIQVIDQVDNSPETEKPVEETTSGMDHQKLRQ